MTVSHSGSSVSVRGESRITPLGEKLRKYKIETAKMHGLEVRDYLAHVFREIMNGNKDCSTYVPEAFWA